MKKSHAVLSLLVLFAAVGGFAQSAPPAGGEQEIIAREKQWAAAIQRQDVGAMSEFLQDGYFLAIGVQGTGPVRIVPRAAWLENLKFYETKSFSMDDIQVHTYGTTAVVLMLFTQSALVRGHDRSGQFVLTDIWVKGPAGWRVAERHSSRPEPAGIVRPAAPDKP